jgi:hypothetical protein
MVGGRPISKVLRRPDQGLDRGDVRGVADEAEPVVFLVALAADDLAVALSLY